MRIHEDVEHFVGEFESRADCHAPPVRVDHAGVLRELAHADSDCRLHHVHRREIYRLQIEERGAHISAETLQEAIVCDRLLGLDRLATRDYDRCR